MQHKVVACFAGLCVGLLTWGAASFAGWIRFGKFAEIRSEGFDYYLFCLLLAPLHLLVENFNMGWLAAASTYRVKLLSGPLLHTVFWAAVFLCVENARTPPTGGGGAPEG